MRRRLRRRVICTEERLPQRLHQPRAKVHLESEARESWERQVGQPDGQRADGQFEGEEKKEPESEEFADEQVGLQALKTNEGRFGEL